MKSLLRFFFASVILLTAIFPAFSAYIIGGIYFYKCAGNDQYEFTKAHCQDSNAGSAHFDKEGLPFDTYFISVGNTERI